MRWMLALILVTAPLAGCLGGADDPLEEAGGPDDARVIEFPEVREGTVHMDVDMPVVLVGFPDDAVEGLAERLDEETVHHVTGDLNQPIPPDPEGGVEGNTPLAGSSYEMPIAPTAVFDVHAASDALEEDLAAHIGQASHVGDAASVEAFLVDALAEDGVDVDENRPLMVVLNSDAFDGAPDQWRYAFPHGYLDPVTVFGEREPILVMDTSHLGLDPGEDGDLDEIDQLVRDAMHFRLLQGSVYPVPTADCHALTLVTAYRPTSQAQFNPDMMSAEELFHPEEIEAGFNNLTSDPVHVDVKMLELPLDDPALDAISRGEFGTFEAQRAWISMNWEDYWVEHEGCEAYVSFLVHTDAASTPAPVIGIGTYDEDQGYRVALSWVNDLLRFAYDPNSPAHEDPSMDRFNWVDYLHAHEAGHIFSMRHPHDISTTDGSGSSNMYEDVWSAMSYSTDGRVIDFGAVDHANFERNKAAFLVQLAHEEGLEETFEFEHALEHLSNYEWTDASAELSSLIQEGSDGEHAGSMTEEIWVQGPPLPVLGQGAPVE